MPFISTLQISLFVCFFDFETNIGEISIESNTHLCNVAWGANLKSETIGLMLPITDKTDAKFNTLNCDKINAPTAKTKKSIFDYQSFLVLVNRQYILLRIVSQSNEYPMINDIPPPLVVLLPCFSFDE